MAKGPKKPAKKPAPKKGAGKPAGKKNPFAKKLGY